MQNSVDWKQTIIFSNYELMTLRLLGALYNNTFSSFIAASLVERDSSTYNT